MIGSAVAGASFGVGSFSSLRALGFRIGAVAAVVLVVALVGHRFQSKSVLRGSGLYGVVGRMGAGKSYFMAKAATEARVAGRAVFANFDVVGATRFESWDEIVNLPDRSLVLIDEAGRWWPSESWKVPIEVREWITHIRKQRQTVLWAAQDTKQVSRWLRDLSFGIWECKRWRSGHAYSLFDAGEFFRTRSPKPELRVVLRRSKRVMGAYDTFELVGSSVEWGGSDVGYAAAELGR